jgi:3-keto-disaccharide hydrolase
MRPFQSMLSVSIIVAGLAVPAIVAAQTPRNRPPQPNEQWVQLFNGKDLTNWVEVGKEKWTIEDGTIHGQGVSSAYGYLRTEKRYKDFWLSLRFKCEADGNSGVYFHTDFKPGTVDVSQGKQFEIDRTPNHHTGGLYGDGRNWFAWPSPEYEHVIRPTDWNDMLLKVEGNHMVAILNGITILDFTDPSPRSSEGYIALQLHSGGLGNMRFKDIYVRDLSAPPAPAAAGK